MSKLDAFRPRIINWARVYRNRYHRAQSPLAIVLRDLQMRAGNKALPPASKALRPYDSEDADLLDRCAFRLRRDQLDVLRIAYLDRHTALDCETAEDAWRAEKKKARIAHCSVRFWRQLVREAETELMRMVQSLEGRDRTGVQSLTPHAMERD